MNRHVKTLAASFIALALSATMAGCADPAVSDATSAIDAIGEISLESRDAVEEANEKYDALSDEQKEQVENYQELEDANDALDALLYEDLEKQLERGQEMKTGSFSAYYDVTELTAAIDAGYAALADSGRPGCAEEYDALVAEIDEFEEFTASLEDESLSRETNDGEYSYAVEGSDIEYAYQLNPLVKRSSDYPYGVCFFEGETTDAPNTFYFKINNQACCVYYFTLENVSTTLIEVQDEEGELQTVLVNTRLALTECQDNWGQDNSLYPMDEQSCYLYLDKDNGLTLAMPDLVGGEGYITYSYN